MSEAKEIPPTKRALIKTAISVVENRMIFERTCARIDPFASMSKSPWERNMNETMTPTRAAPSIPTKGATGRLRLSPYTKREKRRRNDAIVYEVRSELAKRMKAPLVTCPYSARARPQRTNGKNRKLAPNTKRLARGSWSLIQGTPIRMSSNDFRRSCKFILRRCR